MLVNKLLKESLLLEYTMKVVPLLNEGVEDLYNVFNEYNKLSGDAQKDATYLNEFYRLLKEDDNFDPFSHLQGTNMIDEDNDCVLTFSNSNSKLKGLNITTFALPAGYSCPFAAVCKSFAHKEGGKFASTGKSIKDAGDIRCYAANAELAYPSVRKMRWRNFDLLNEFKGDSEAMASLILKSIRYHEQNNKPIQILRIHDSGDFYSQAYFDAWLKVAQSRTDLLFYAYTKALPFWQARKADVPKNLRLIASEGGKRDDLIDKEGFRKAVIVKDQGDAIKQRLNIDVNDFLAVFGDKDFALLLHGTQSAESGDTKKARENSQIIKDAAKKFNTSPNEIQKLLMYYTS